MNEVFIVVALGLLGLSLGSFASATVWRLHKKKGIVRERSECEKCHHSLAWYDLIPLVSWLMLGGRCRYCRTPIRIELPLTEAVLAILFIGSYLVWPYPLDGFASIVLFVLWLLSLVFLTILFLYDIKWFLLPDKAVFPLIAIGALMAIARLATTEDITSALLGEVYAVLILSGLYLILFIISRGKWVGFGDVKLGLFLGLALGSWQFALLCLFLANFIGCLFVIPGILSGRLTRTSRIPFGPFLISGFIVTLLFGQRLIDWYMRIVLML